jgi:lysine-specific histone demethylase 1
MSSRLPYDKMTFEETTMFRDIISDDPLQHTTQFDNYKKFLFVRNKILHMWVDNPKVQLVVEDVFQNFDPLITKTEKPLIYRVYKYLERYSYINFGVFKRIVPLSPVPKGKVIVIGAGIAGLMAARQLREFGFEVTIYEARDRIGGRIATFRKGPFIADLGAMVVTGLGGNPISILSKQISMDLTKIKQKCPIYDNSGKILAKDRDEALEREFNKLLESTSFLTHNLDFDPKIDKKPISLGHALELVIKLQEKHTKKRLVDYHMAYREKQQEFIDKAKILLASKERIMELTEAYRKLRTEWCGENKLDCVEEFRLRIAFRELKNECRRFNELTLSLEEIEKKITQMDANEPAVVYLSVSDRQVLDWHFANLEFANATPLSLLSLKHWDQDDEFEFSGHHMTGLLFDSSIKRLLSS